MSAKKPVPADKTVFRWMLCAVPLMFFLGSATHFLYEWSGSNPIAGIFCPVNESVWEHLKMAFWVPLFWWIIKYLRLSKKYDISAARWFSACAAALYASIIFIILVYYAYTGAFGTELLIIDILLLLFGIAAGQLTAFHIYKHAKPREGSLRCSVIAIALLAAAFSVFTFAPPHIPLFADPNSGTYGRP